MFVLQGTFRVARGGGSEMATGVDGKTGGVRPVAIVQTRAPGRVVKKEASAWRGVG